MSVGLELFLRKMDQDIKDFAHKYPEEMEKYLVFGPDSYDRKSAEGFMDTVVQIRGGRKVPYQDRIDALNLSSDMIKRNQVQNHQWPNSDAKLYTLKLSTTSPTTNVVECIDELIQKNYNAIR